MMQGFGDTIREVMMSLGPLAFLFLFSGIFSTKLPMKKVIEISAGFVLILLGLSIFLQGVYAGFLPMGKAIGEAFGIWRYRWLLVPFGFLLGFAGTMAEPAVRVLNYQVEKLTSGYIPQKIMLLTLSIGVGVAVSLAMFRILAGLPLRYIVMPGYILAFILMIFSKKSFIAIAFDSGGVASGPMTATFITSLTIGVASGIDGRDRLSDGLGLVALVALFPIITVLILGMLYSFMERRINTGQRVAVKKDAFTSAKR